jgi:predicted DNA-binding transcriptional regulator AlpA
VAQQLAVARETVESWRHRSRGARLPYVKLGRAVRYRPADVAAFVQSRLCSA